MYSVDIYNRVRRACLKDGMSAREAARYFNKDRKTIAKMLRHELPPGYQRSEPPRRPTLDDYVGVIDEILRSDKALIKKQRHTSKRIFERLRDEHGYAGSLTTVTYYVREQTVVVDKLWHSQNSQSKAPPLFQRQVRKHLLKLISGQSSGPSETHVACLNYAPATSKHFKLC